jgi:hypothetical protein
MKYLAEFELAAQAGEFKNITPWRSELIKQSVYGQNKYGVWTNQVAVLIRFFAEKGLMLEIHEGGEHEPEERFPYFDAGLNDIANTLLAAKEKMALEKMKSNNGVGNDK